MSTELEEIATAALDDEDGDVVFSAASVLREYGNADAEKALWSRFEKWHEAMQGQVDEQLTKEEPAEEETNEAQPDVKLTYDDGKIEEGLREALSRGNAWLADPEKLKRARELCVSRRCRTEVDRLISDWDCQIYVAFYSPNDEPSGISVAHYPDLTLDGLKAKLLQFPKGTVFKFKTGSDNDHDLRTKEWFQQFKTYLEEHGMKLQDPPEHQKVIIR